LITGILWLMMGFLLLANRKNATLKHTLIVFAAVLLVILLVIAGLLILEDVSETQAEQSGKAVSYGSRFDDAASTFNIRVHIWGTGLQILRDRPLGLLIGELHENAMQRMTTIAGEYRPHLHNSFMETLVIGGIPAALLMVVCSALFLLHAFRLVFNKRAPLTSKILVLPLVGLFIHAIVENYIFTFDELPNLFFFLLAGMVAYESKTWRVKKA
jgi:O-antigen ligase